ncbi:hypothetical protein Ahy_B04g070669 [Arachis hypogaea]|uniref:Uncharacterized protein n=1 Tax=Arachis hypogaea TaxID=3818 RepID=A0A444ZII8_ARAHY|nr:hypothetical protein Ahy_B04g070669 [Arachis hypogaea]
MLVVKTVILRTFMKINVVVNNLDNAHEMLDTAISTALKESKPVYISIKCIFFMFKKIVMITKIFSFDEFHRLSNQMELEAAIEAAADFHGNMSV